MKISLVTLTILLGSVLLGALYTYLISRNIASVDQPASEKPRGNDIKNFYSRLPLIVVNIVILAVLSFSAIYIFSDYFKTEGIGIIPLLIQFLIVILLDDIEFYLWHRFLHLNKFMLRKVHAIHHRVRAPYPLDFIYVHPVEWMGGTLGLIIAFICIVSLFGAVSAYVLWVYTAFRTLHECLIHANTNMSLHHMTHHKYARCNYASTLIYLDQLFRTQLKPDSAITNLPRIK